MLIIADMSSIITNNPSGGYGALGGTTNGSEQPQKKEKKSMQIMSKVILLYIINYQRY